MPEDKKHFSERLQTLLREQGKTVTDLAKRLGVSPQAVRNWHDGINLPRPKMQEAIAAILGRTQTSTNDASLRQEIILNADAISLEDLIRAIEAKGFIVEIRPRPYQKV